jgi:hypothetical protein
MNATSALPKADPAGLSETFGVCAVICARFVWLRASSIAALTAVIAIGVSWTFVSRNVAVTMISSSWLSCDQAICGPAAEPARAATIAECNAVLFIEKPPG